MVDKFAEASLHELEVLLDSLFEGAARIPVRAAPGVYFGYDPVIGQLFISNEDHSSLRLMICRALVAKEKFREAVSRSGWPWPDLPLRAEEIEELENCDNVRCNITGFFGGSLRREGWCREHPGFVSFVGGLLADKYTPRHLRTNPELLQQFAPRKLAGITGGSLTWRSPETLALDRRMKQMIAEHEAAREDA